MLTLNTVKLLLDSFNYVHPEYRLFLAVKQPESPTMDTVRINVYHLPNRVNTISMGCFEGLNAAMQAVIDHSKK